jgi:hypothetical protein
VVLGAGGRHSSLELSHSGGGFGRGMGGEGWGAHHSPICGRRRVGKPQVMAGRRCPGAWPRNAFSSAVLRPGRGRSGAGGWGDRVELLDGTEPRPKALEEGTLGSRRADRMPASSSGRDQDVVRFL